MSDIKMVCICMISNARVYLGRTNRIGLRRYYCNSRLLYFHFNRNILGPHLYIRLPDETATHMSLLQRVLHDLNYDVAIWLDASIRLHADGEAFLEEAVKRGGIYLPLDSGIQGSVVTHPGLYRYLPPYSIVSEKEHQKGTGFVVLFNTETIYWKVLHWWYLCALDESCQAPPGHSHNCAGFDRCTKNHTATCRVKCHRYDQSTLNILYHNYLYGMNQTALIPPNRGHETLFEVIRWPSKLFSLKGCK